MRRGPLPGVVLVLPVDPDERPEASFALTERCLLRARPRRSLIFARASSLLMGVSGTKEDEFWEPVASRRGTLFVVESEG